MATVSIILRNDVINKKGEAPINFFVIKDRKLTKVSTGILIDPKHWDDKNKRIKAGQKNSARLNSFLTNKFAELQDKVYEHETISKSLTTRQLKEKIYGKTPADFFGFTNEVIEKYKRENKIATYDKSRSIIKKLKDYLGEKTIDFQDITPDFLEKYESYLRTELKNKTNSIHKDLKFLRKVFNDAIRLDKISAEHNPFTKYKLKQEKTQRTYLTEEELSAFENIDCAPGTRLELHRDMFVFAAYTGGLRVSDVLQLKWNDFDGSHIHFKVQKTGSQLSIKLPNKALDILKKYKPIKVNKDEFIFPMLPNGLDLKNFKLIDQRISGATAYINKNLKILAKEAKINKPISFHMSRHTWATRALLKGITIDKVSKLMGHAQIRETQIYAKIVSSELDKAMDIFNE